MIKEFVTSIGINLSFQKFDEEFAILPGRYAPPTSRLLLAGFNTTDSLLGASRSGDSKRAREK